MLGDPTIFRLSVEFFITYLNLACFEVDHAPSAIYYAWNQNREKITAILQHFLKLNDQDYRLWTYGQFRHFLISVDSKRPESLYVLDFEERDLGHTAVLFE